MISHKYFVFFLFLGFGKGVTNDVSHLLEGCKGLWARESGILISNICSVDKTEQNFKIYFNLSLRMTVFM